MEILVNTRPLRTGLFERLPVAFSLMLLMQLAVDAQVVTLGDNLGPSNNFQSCCGWNNYTTDVAVAFTPSSTAKVGHIDVPLQLFSVAPPQVTFDIRTDSSGVPGTPIAQFIFTSIPGGTGTVVGANSALNPTLVAGTQYWLVMNAFSGAIDSQTIWKSSADVGVSTTFALYMHDGTSPWSVFTSSPILGHGGPPSFRVLGGALSGTISVSTNLPSAAFTMTGSAMYTGSGTSFTVTTAPPGTYTISFNAVAGYATPPSQVQTLSAGGSVSFSGTYTTLAAPPASTITGATGTSTNRTASVSEPVNTATGNYLASVTDVTIPGKGLSLVFTRSYNSQDSYAGPMGSGWTHSYNVYLTVDGTTGVAGIKQGDGHQEFYSPSGDGYTAQTPGLFSALVRNGDGSFTQTFKNQTKFNFSSAGRLSTVVDRNGNTQTLAYDGSGKLATVTDPSGRVLGFSYDASGRIVALTDPLSRTLHYSYDASGNLVSFQDALGNTTQYAYDSSHHMTSGTDPRGTVYMQNTYDSQGRVTQQKNARNFTTTFGYNTPIAGTTTITDPVGNVTQHVYDTGLRLVGVVNAIGGTTAHVYDANNLKASETNPLGTTSVYTYDANGNLLTSTDAIANTTTFVYDGQNNLLSITDPLGRQTAFTYDARGNVLTTVDAAGNTTVNTYDSSGLLLTTKNARNFVTAFQYNTNGHRTQVTDALGGATQMTYDVVGHLLTTKNALGKTWTSTYDANGRLLGSTDPLGNTTRYTYDGNGNRTQVTDANGKVTGYAYDLNNNLTQVTDAANGVTTYAYNGNNDRIGITDANGHTTTSAYDSLRRLKSRTDPLGRVQTHGYDAVGNRTSTIDGNGKTNSFTYDTLNRRVGASLSDGKTLSYTDDAAGNRLTVVDWRGTTSYTYDALNRVTSAAQPVNSAVTYVYDAVGNRSSITYPDLKVVHYQYDALNRLTQTTDWSTQATTSGYDAAGNLVTTANPNGTSTAYAYDDAGRLVNVTNRSGTQVTSAYTYVLDKVGNRMEVASFNEGVQRYGYDPLYRLTSWTSPSRQTVRYAYDAVGNRLSVVAPTGTVNSTYDAADELLTAGGAAFAYDGNGNQLSKTTAGTTLTYGWDAVNRLISVTGGGVNTQYQYDGDGNRVSQQTSAGTYAYMNDTATVLPVVVNESGPDGNISYAYGSSLISASATGLQSFYQFDGLGSVATVTDGAASQKASFVYDPWGSVIGGADLLGTKNKFEFTGEAVDPGTGLVFLRARYYEPQSGRFLSVDQVPSSRQSPYIYAEANPVINTDPTGDLTFAAGGGFDVSFFLGISNEISLIEDDKGHKGIAWDAGVLAGFDAGASANYTISITNAGDINELQSRGLGDFGMSLGASGAFGVGLGASVEADSQGQPTGFSVSVSGGADVQVGAGLGYTNVMHISDWLWSTIARRAGAAGIAALAFDAAVKSGSTTELVQQYKDRASGFEGQHSPSKSGKKQ